MKLLTPIQMNEVDKYATTRYGLPSLLLMEHAAKQIFDYINENYNNQSITIICGPGNNGGDGLALARLLVSFTKSKVKVWMLASEDKLTADGKIYYEICKNLKVDMNVVSASNKQHVIAYLKNEKVIVDAIFGTGIKRSIEGTYKEIIEAINDSTAAVISVDIPSGIDGVTGKVMGTCVDADITITFMAPKVGLFLYPGNTFTGEVKVVNIGIPYTLIEEVPSQIFSIEKEEMSKLLPIRPMRSNKGTYGKVLAIGGSLGMSGAISLTSLAAYRVGCGTVTAVVPWSIIEIMQVKLTEVMSLPMAENDGFFDIAAKGQLQEVIKKYNIVAIGPGMGRTNATLEMLKVVLASDKPCVIDADALYFIPLVLDLLKQRKAPTLLTPHPGEMARMTGKSIEEILENPVSYAQKFAKDFGVILLLKIEKTVIADWSGNIYINRCGNQGMAKGGSGDALTGIVAGLLAQHMAPIDAAKLGVYLQTRAADLAKEELSQYSYLASDTIMFLSRVFNELEPCK